MSFDGHQTLFQDAQIYNCTLPCKQPWDQKQLLVLNLQTEVKYKNYNKKHKKDEKVIQWDWFQNMTSNINTIKNLLL